MLSCCASFYLLAHCTPSVWCVLWAYGAMSVVNSALLSCWFSPYCFPVHTSRDEFIFVSMCGRCSTHSCQHGHPSICGTFIIPCLQGQVKDFLRVKTSSRLMHLRRIYVCLVCEHGVCRRIEISPQCACHWPSSCWYGLCAYYISMYLFNVLPFRWLPCDRTDSWGCRLILINSGNDGGGWGKDIFWCVGFDEWWVVSRNTLLVVQMFCFCGRYFKRVITGQYIYVGANVSVYGGDVSLSPFDSSRSLPSKPNQNRKDWGCETDEYGVSKRFVKRRIIWQEWG